MLYSSKLSIESSITSLIDEFGCDVEPIVFAQFRVLLFQARKRLLIFAGNAKLHVHALLEKNKKRGNGKGRNVGLRYLRVALESVVYSSEPSTLDNIVA